MDKTVYKLIFLVSTKSTITTYKYQLLLSRSGAGAKCHPETESI